MYESITGDNMIWIFISYILTYIFLFIDYKVANDLKWQDVPLLYCCYDILVNDNAYNIMAGWCVLLIPGINVILTMIRLIHTISVKRKR